MNCCFLGMVWLSVKRTRAYDCAGECEVNARFVPSRQPQSDTRIDGIVLGFPRDSGLWLRGRKYVVWREDYVLLCLTRLTQPFSYVCNTITPSLNTKHSGSRVWSGNITIQRDDDKEWIKTRRKW